ncbi:hypothetical protein MML48_6g00017260 [Holotrichia oblita]|uniref:Uncharacterized protein n=1 Tax=Holotrichia oblita TaxID=644536 RepID=A0ACB9SZW6_HOLOL|nr:hypothetical protein MML48_6g00017260 [Holotrichia oblita]
MCEEESSVTYNNGDVVWVKLGPCWWPGEIVQFDDLPTDITESFKKPPLAVVKFFDEEKYEFVKQLNRIALYNSSKKYEYIKKGLDLYRAKHAFMDKFRGDVVTAEKKVEGDPNILSDPKLEPEKKPNYASIFGSPAQKKPKDSPSRGRGRSSTGKSITSPASSKKMYSLITHPRFLGKDDCEIRVLVQAPSESKIPEHEYKCYSCGFKSNRIEVIVFHNKFQHRSGGGSRQSSPKKIKKSPLKRSQKRRFPLSKTATIEEDLELLRQGLPLCSEDSSDDESSISSSSSSKSSSSSSHHSTSSSDEEPLIKRKPVKPVPKPIKPAKATDICTDILAEWVDDEDEEDIPIQTVAERLSPKPPQEEDAPRIENEKSCFDFVEDEESPPVTTVEEGRKIPRVIPPTDRRKSLQDAKSRSSTPRSIETNIVESESDKPNDNKDADLGDESESLQRKRDSQFQKEFEAFNNALKEDVTVPKLLDIPALPKYEQNFHNAKTIKFPDKLEDEEEPIRKDTSPPPPVLEKEEPVKVEGDSSSLETPPPIEAVKEVPIVKNTEIATKLTNPKKRFVKTFEDETKNSSKENVAAAVEKVEEPSLEAETKQELKSLEVSKLKTQLMKKLGDGKKESAKHGEKSRSTPVRSSKRLKIATVPDLAQLHPVENRDNKRNISEVASENEVKSSSKKKKFTAEYLDDSNNSQDIDVDLVIGTKSKSENKVVSRDSPVDEKIHRSPEPKSTSHLDYINTSPTKIFKDLNVDQDKLIDASSLSESQRLTIQSIIGVPSSTTYPIKSSLNNKEEIKVTDEVKTLELPEKILEESPEESMEIDLSQKSEEKPELIDLPKEPPLSPDIFEEDPEIVPDQIFDVTEKLPEVVPEKLPDEIIETKNEVIEEKIKEVKDEPIPEENIQSPIKSPDLKLQDEPKILTETEVKDDKLENEELKKVESENEINEIQTVAEESKTIEDDTNKLNTIIDDSTEITDIIEETEKPTEQIEIESTTEKPAESAETKKDDLCFEQISKTTTELVKSMLDEEAMVNIEGNLTVVTESELADKQVEIAASPEISKPITLSSFSMDFCEEVQSYVKEEIIIRGVEQEKPASIDDADQKELVEVEIELPPIEVKNKKRRADRDKDKLMLDIESIDNNEGIKMKKFKIGAEFKRKNSTNSRNPLAKDKEKVAEPVEEKIKVDEPPKGDSYQPPTTQDIIKEISQKEEIIIPPIDISVESEVAKITDSIAEQDIVLQDNQHSTSSTKLLEILTDKPKSNHASKPPVIPQNEKPPTVAAKSTYSKHSKLVTKQSTPGPSGTPKATILSDKLIKPVDDSKMVSVKKVTSKRSYQDVEDIDAYIIQKPVKKLNVSADSDPTTPKMLKKTPIISKGKARILQQTIITPTGDILQPPVSQAAQDDNMFDINSMPIVLSDQILTPEGIENMQIVLQESPVTTKTQLNPIKKVTSTQPQQVKLLNKSQTSLATTLAIKETILKNPMQKPPTATISKQKIQKLYTTATTTPATATKILKHSSSVIAQPGKQGKFIIVPATTTPTTGSKYTVGKRPAIVKKPTQKIMTPISKMPETTMTSSSGSKIMIVKGQGQQQKILLTPPKQSPPSKFKGRTIAQKQILAKDSPQQAKGANIISQTIVNSKGQITTLANQNLIGARGQQIVASVTQSHRNIKIDSSKMKRIGQQRVSLPSDIIKPSTSGHQRTIIIKNPQGQTVKKIQGTDDALLDQQVAEQLQAISRASANQHLKDLSPRISAKSVPKKPYIKKHEPIKQAVTKTIAQSAGKNISVPPLAPISPTKKSEQTSLISSEAVDEKPEESKRPPHQLVIQDAQGNQTTITEGQILALPSEAIDGQPHSYVLVTLDETGNLTPLNSEALMSLDPNLNLTSDLGNMVLQIDQGAASEPEGGQIAETPPQPATVPPQIEPTVAENLLLKEADKPAAADNVLLPETPPSSEAAEQNVQAVINSGEMGQLIITGDAVTAQKFLESLAEGNADLANLLANAEGNVLIQADGQQILINTDSENPMLVMNPENISGENSEGSGNPIFASQPAKNQDILAAALADTDVFQQDQSISHSPSKVAQSQLSPNSTLYPMNVTNVLETNSMSSPIMTPLEVPSTNSKKIDDENEILNQVPKNVDLPITITDPNISQTVAQQQVASLMASELQTNLDLPLAIQDPGMSVTSAEMSSPSFVYSLPALDDINQKAFSGSISMPLLTEEPEEVAESSSSAGASSVKERKLGEDDKEKKDVDDDKDDKNISRESTSTNESDSKDDDKKTDFLDRDGLCPMRICNSLSEPPPDMFEISVDNRYDSSHMTRTNEIDIPMDSMPSSEASNTINDHDSSVSSVDERKNDDPALYTVNSTSPSTNTDDSCEIPVQPPIIARSFEENGTSDSRVVSEKMVTDGDV